MCEYALVHLDDVTSSSAKRMQTGVPAAFFTEYASPSTTMRPIGCAPPPLRDVLAHAPRRFVYYVCKR